MTEKVRTWTNPPDYPDTLIGMTDQEVFAVKLPAIDENLRARGAVESGAGPADALGAKARIIRFGQVQRILSVPGRNCLDVEYLEGSEAKAYRLHFQDGEDCVAAMAALGATLAGQSFQPGTEKVSAFRAAFKPGLIIVLVVLFTIMFFAAAVQDQRAGEAPPGGRTTVKKATVMLIISALGPGGVLAAGLACLVCAGIWLLICLVKRPERAVLRRCQQPPAVPPTDSR